MAVYLLQSLMFLNTILHERWKKSYSFVNHEMARLIERRTATKRRTN